MQTLQVVSSPPRTCCHEVQVLRNATEDDVPLTCNTWLASEPGFMRTPVLQQMCVADRAHWTLALVPRPTAIMMAHLKPPSPGSQLWAAEIDRTHPSTAAQP